MKFSVLMPVYHGDQPKLFSAAIESILQNTVKPDQIVLVVDGPIGIDLEHVIKKYENDLFDIIRISNNQGIVNALNSGLLVCKNSLVARCDSDDENVYNRFELQLMEFAKDPNLSLCGGQIIERSDKKEFQREVPVKKKQIEQRIKFRNPFNHMTVMYKKKCVLECGLYDEIKYREDYALWAKMISKGKKLINVDNTLVYATTGDSMYERRGKPSDIQYEIKLQQLLLKLGLINLYTFFFNLIIRCSNMLISSKVRGFIYKKFLRKSYSTNTIGEKK